MQLIPASAYPPLIVKPVGGRLYINTRHGFFRKMSVKLVLHCGPQKFSTVIHKKCGKTPNWTDKFHLTTPGDKCTLFCYDVKIRRGKEILLGMATVFFPEILPPNLEFNGWIPLKSSTGGHVGDVMIHIKPLMPQHAPQPNPYYHPQMMPQQMPQQPYPGYPPQYPPQQYPPQQYAPQYYPQAQPIGGYAYPQPQLQPQQVHPEQHIVHSQGHAYHQQPPQEQSLAQNPSSDFEPSISANPDVKECSICNTNAKEVAFVPCGHILACSTCSQKLIGQPCGLCGQLIQSVIKVYQC